jgi:hypothetical protein
MNHLMGKPQTLQQETYTPEAVHCRYIEEVAEIGTLLKRQSSTKEGLITPETDEEYLDRIKAI